MPTTKQPKSKLNVKLLRKIQKHILEEPRRFVMSMFVARGQPGQGFDVRFHESDLAKTVPPCGTAACIAGWANLLTGGMEEGDHFRAADVLGLDREMAWNVFGADSWPDHFWTQFRKARYPKVRAKIAAARIEHLIETGE